mgnify:CR=1 FL=1
MDAKYIKAMKPRDLTEEEKQRPYAKLFYKPQPDISARTKKYWQAVSRWIRNMR